MRSRPEVRDNRHTRGDLGNKKKIRENSCFLLQTQGLLGESSWYKKYQKTAERRITTRGRNAGARSRLKVLSHVGVIGKFLSPTGVVTYMDSPFL